MATQLLEDARAAQEIAQLDFDAAVQSLSDAEAGGITEEIEAAMLARNEASVLLQSATTFTTMSEEILATSSSITTEMAQ